MHKMTKNTVFIFVIRAVAVMSAFGATEVMAGPPPSFETVGTVTKVAAGWNRGPGNKVQATDGTTFYSLTGTWEDGPIKIVRSRDSGATWEPARIVAEMPFQWAFAGVATVAVSGDAAIPERKIVHVVWEQWDDNHFATVGIYYAWADDADLNDPWTRAFSTPVRINGTIPAVDSWARTCINTTPNGEIHVIFQGSADEKLYYTYASRYNDEFTAPVSLPGQPSGWEDIEATLDGDGNLHVAYPISDVTNTLFGLEYTRKPADSMTWTTPVTVAPLVATGQDEGFTSIAAYDADSIYIANHDWKDMYVYRTRDGGATWERTAVFNGTAEVMPTRHISIAVNHSHDVYVGTGFDHYLPNGDWDYEEAQIFRSTDRGRSFSNGGIIPNQTSVSINFDADGKAAINLWGTNVLEGAIYFTKEKRTGKRIGNPNA